MNVENLNMWDKFMKWYREYPEIGLAIDLSRMNFPEDYLEKMLPKFQKAFKEMQELESGAIANPDEHRMVGHYWLRAPELAPTEEIKNDIINTINDIKEFSREVHSGKIRGQTGVFKNLLVIGIGGSALGPQFVANALGNPSSDKMSVFFFDNTDPDGMDRVMTRLASRLGETLVIVISKSGSTVETRNGMLEIKHAYKNANLDFSQHAVAITERGSKLDQLAEKERWLKRFPMWEWVGGRTSETSAVGLLPAALQGIDIDQVLDGARHCDRISRDFNVNDNPSALLALAWFFAGNGKGEKDMVVLPYKDRLELFSRYLQQLVMESLGKETDKNGNVVHQGLVVYGNKGSTDQHAFVQQLRDGPNNFFVTFIEVLLDRDGPSINVDNQVTSGDYLFGFLLGTRNALFEKDRLSLTITLKQVSPFSIGVLIALFERAVGFYASLININAYHQPGVAAGKKGADDIINLQRDILKLLETKNKTPLTAEEIAHLLNKPNHIEIVFKICNHLSANPYRNIKKSPGKTPFDARFSLTL